VFTFVLLLTQIFRLAELIINRGVNAFLIGQTLGALLPPILMITVPMSLLLAVLLAFGRLSADREIMAIRTSGIHLASLYMPAVAVGIAMTIVFFPVTMVVVPSNRAGLRELRDDLAFELVTTLSPGDMHRPEMEDSSQTIHLRYLERGEQPGEMKKVMLHLVTAGIDEKSGRTEMIVLAREGALVPRRDIHSIDIDLRDGEVHYYDEFNPGEYTLIRFDRLVKRFGLDMDDTGALPPEATMIDDLLSEKTSIEAQIEEYGGEEGGRLPLWLRKRLERLRLLETELWTRLSMPLACLAFVMIGVPLGIMGRTSSRTLGVTTAFGLIFLYYVMLKWGTSLGQEGSPLAWLAIMSPNLVLITVGLILIGKTIRR
jgi:lipopolysaccharide export system permease protein